MKYAMLAALALALSACATEEEAGRWEAAEQDLVNTGGGSLGFSCTATRCECTPGGDGTDAATCIGMDAVCHSHGSTTICTYPPGGGPGECHCDWAAPVRRVTLRTGVVSGGAVLAR